MLWLYKYVVVISLGNACVAIEGGERNARYRTYATVAMVTKAAGLNNRTSKPTKIAEGRQVAVVGMEGEKDRSTLVEPATATCLPDAISDRSRADCTKLMRIVRQSAHLTSDIRLDGH